MSIKRGFSRAAAAAVALAALAALTPAPPARAQAGAVEIKRFAPDHSNVLLEPSVPPAVDPRGSFFVTVVNSRLLAVVDAVTGAYRSSLDLGVEAGAAIEASPRAPVSLSDDGRVLAVAAGDMVRFFEVDNAGALSPVSEYAAPTGAGVPVWFSKGNEFAVFASGPLGAVTTVRVRNGNELDSVPLSADETPLETLADTHGQMISVVTRRNVLVFRYEDNGKVRQTATYRRDTPPADQRGSLLAPGRKGLSVFTVEEGGSALVALSVRSGKQAARVTPDPRERFTAPVATSPDLFKVVVASVSAATGEPRALYLFKAKGRGLSKVKPKTVDIPEGWGRVGRLVFDPTSTYIVATFPDSQRVALIDMEGRSILDSTQAVGSPGAAVFRPDGDAVLVPGSATGDPLTPGAPGAVTILPIARRELDDAAALRFRSLPGVLFGPADRAFTFANKSFAVVSSGAADAIYSFNVFSLGELARIDVGPSTGFMALAPDNRTLVASGRGGLMVIRVEDTGAFSVVGTPAAGAVPSDLAPSVAFHPTLPLAFVTAGDSVWRADLVSGRIDRFRVGGAGSSLSNPKVGAGGERLYFIEDGDTLVRLALDAEGSPTILNAIRFDATLDARAPRVAYDEGGARMWAVDGGVVRQFDLLLGFESGTSDARAVGRYPVLVAPNLLAVLPDAAGAVALYDVTGGRPVFSGETAAGGAPLRPLPGGTVGVDAASRTLYLPFPGASRVASLVVPGGAPVDIDDASAAAHVWLVPGGGQLAYPDLSSFPGSAVVATLGR